MINPPTPILAAIIQVVVIMLICGFTLPSSFLRPAAIPILCACAYIVVTKTQTYTGPGFAATFAAYSFTIILQYIEVALLSRWSYENDGPTSQFTTKKHQSNGKLGVLYTPSSIREDTIWGRLKFGYDRLISFRNVNSPYEVKNVPPFSYSDPDYVPSRTQFLAQNILRFCICYSIMDAIESLPKAANIAEVCDPAKAPVYLQLNHVTLEDVVFKLSFSAVMWLFIYCLLKCVYLSVALPAVASGYSSPKSWRPWNGKFASSYTLRGFWGKYWHQSTRKLISPPSTFLVKDVLQVPSGISSRYTIIFLTFFLSGIIHIIADYAGGIPPHISGSMKFFPLQAVGIMIEDAVQAIWRKISGSKMTIHDADVAVWKKLVGWCWVILYLGYYTTPMWQWAMMASPNYDPEVRVTPFSVVQLVWRG